MNKLKSAIIFHGTMSSPEGNWFRWLEGNLENRGMAVWLPALPNANQPSLKQWVEFVQQNCPFEINQDTLIIGHSSGAILSLISTQENTSKVGKVIAVSVFHDNSLNWEANSKLFDVDFNWQKIKSNCSDITFIHSNDDPYVPLEQAQYVAISCGCEVIMIPGQGHFNLEKSENYLEFQKLLEFI